MDLHVKQFTVRYQGKDCGPGSIIYDVDQELGENLIADSNGTIEALPEREVSAASTTDVKVSADIGASTVADTSTETGDSTATLPSVDPKKTVK
ncbi:hypothetical protein SPSIL_009000 [Sporomusa silvacetica DSM 10669]|uniref:Uncharacterized protein n=1 Tax=Sporomusa silvacetica DSM 10669 TaxID=1123289 RepID=A0ABZ3IGI7_9FIRM|nr:hypothetical protein [Sporomusa silvacetica]OZC13140.1 hypothetical protein SPSIL_55960 [Sporomusa silvacetica DSM 10669]